MIKGLLRGKRMYTRSQLQINSVYFYVQKLNTKVLPSLGRWYTTRPYTGRPVQAGRELRHGPSRPAGLLGSLLWRWTSTRQCITSAFTLSTFTIMFSLRASLILLCQRKAGKPPGPNQLMGPLRPPSPTWQEALLVMSPRNCFAESSVSTT